MLVCMAGCIPLEQVMCSVFLCSILHLSNGLNTMVPCGNNGIISESESLP